MAESSSLYLRVPRDLKEQLEGFIAQKPEQQLTDGVVELMRRGLRFEEMNAELTESKRKATELDSQKALLAQQLQITRVRLSTVESQVRQLNQWLYTPIAKCRHCTQVGTIMDVVAHQCPQPGGPAGVGFDLLEQYRGEKGALEILRDISAVVGGVAIAAAALKAIDAESALAREPWDTTVLRAANAATDAMSKSPARKVSAGSVARLRHKTK